MTTPIDKFLSVCQEKRETATKFPVVKAPSGIPKEHGPEQFIEMKYSGVHSSYIACCTEKNADFITYACNNSERLEKMVRIAVEALDFYADSWGPHHGNDPYTNQVIMETLNKSRFKATEAIDQITRLAEEGLE